ncbi:M28 family peptidase [Gemmatimonas sp.]|uniref:M28 family peptidase n=1 Tax=Gemmatimonas sp. TaxID=1962908 RepID=UPI003982E1F1
MLNMQTLRYLTLAVLCWCSVPRTATAQPSTDARVRRTQAAAQRIRADDILRDVSYLASDANMGRRTPFPGLDSPGYDSAAHYVARFLKSMRVKPMGDDGTYFQHYTVTRSTLDTTKVAGAIGTEQIVWGKDFLINSFLVPGVREANVVYVGNGIQLLKRNVDPYAGLDIRGKWLLLSGAPPQTGRGAVRAGMPSGKVGVDYLTVTEVARFGGALGIITVVSDSALATSTRRAVTGQDLNPSVGVAYAQFQVPSISMSAGALAKLLAGTSLLPETVLSRDTTLDRKSIDLGANNRLRIDFAATTLDARPYNVVGMLEGSDPVLKQEWVSLAAHLDGAVPANGSVRGNALPDQYNAADDNASGSAGNMAVVRALVAAPRAKRSILLIWDSGEEVGLWGTRAIAYGAWSDKLVLHVSNDMIGRSRPNNSPKEQTLSSADSIYVTGPLLLSTRIEAALQRAAREFPFIALDRRYEDVSASYYYPRTDAGPYLERGIPIMQFFNGEHADYHRPSDDVSKLDIQKITNVSKLSFGALWLAADDAQKLTWDGIVPETLWWVTPRRH